ncbi:hypothetical protein DFJ73DRAFT_811372 [Zopfochytrium polystomum]|nr:hypothetical protein DFJ73DRAFT_811372 [Zopfochytrium polystomum]
MGWQRFAERAGVQLLVWSPFVALVVVLVALASSRNVVFSVVPFLRIPAVMVVQLCNMPSEKATLKDVFSDVYHPVAVFTTLRKPADQDGSFYILVALMVLFKPFKTWLNLCWSLFKTRSDTTLSLRRKIETFLSSNYDSSIVIYQRIAIHSSNGVALIAAIFFFAGDSPVQSLSAGCIGRLGGLTSAKIAGRWAIITAAEVMVDVWCVIYRAWARSARHRVRPAEPEDMQSMVDTEAKHESNARGADRDGDADSAMSNRVEDRLVWLGISCALGLTSAVSTCGGVAYLKGLFGSQECNVLGVT